MQVFLPRLLRPVPLATTPEGPGVRRIADAPLTVVHGSPGSYTAERLAGAIERWDRWQGCVWLRADGIRPAGLAGALADACQHRWSGSAEAPSVALTDTIRSSPAGAVIVFELQGRLNGDVARLLDSVRPAVAENGGSLIAVTERRLPLLGWRGADCSVAAGDLVDPGVLVEAGSLPGRWHDRLVRLGGRRAAVLHDLLAAAETWAPEAVVDALDAGGSYRTLMDRLTASLLELCSPAQRAALEVCVATGYWHPQLATDAVQASELRPWVVHLEHQWGWLRPVWARSLGPRLSGRDLRRAATPVATRAPVTQPVAKPETTSNGVLEARLFGAFELRVDGLTVTAWYGQRGTSVLRYLFSRRRHTCPRDELLAAFWPDVAPGIARNRLQVAVSGLRRALREVTNLHVIDYADGSYRINPGLLVRVDVERFEDALSKARAAQRSGDGDRGALGAYGEAVGLYRGDFAADAPYEQWTLLPRESLRIAYIDALDRVSRIQLQRGAVDDCIATGHRMLDVDACREDAHRLLMRCYASQGRTYQAVRQYEFCCRVLKATLDARPAVETTRLHREIRAGFTAKPALLG